MTVEEASQILKMLLGYLKGEIEPPRIKTKEEAEKFEQEGYECLNMAIRSLEAWKLVKKEIENHCEITVGANNEPAMTLYDIFAIIDKHLKEVEK